MDKTYEDMRIYISVLYRQFQIYINNNTKDLQISASEYIFLMEMYKNDNMSQEQLSKNLIIDKSATARAIKSLEEKEYIIRKKDDNDKRSYDVFITELGEKKVDEILKFYLGPIYDLRRKLGEKNFLQLMDCIKMANEKISEGENGK